MKSRIAIETSEAADCSNEELMRLGSFLQSRIDQFTAYSSTFGPTSFEPIRPICLDSSIVNSGSIRNRRMAQIGFRFALANTCKMCKADSRDARTLAEVESISTTSFLLRIMTDDYPHEMGFTLSSALGDVIIAQYAFADKNTPYDIHLNLIPGRQYLLELRDVSGDGWCCSNGIGNAQVFLGNSTTGDLLISSDGKFGYLQMLTFFAPGSVEPSPQLLDAFSDSLAVPLDSDLNNPLFWGNVSSELFSDALDQYLRGDISMYDTYESIFNYFNSFMHSVEVSINDYLTLNVQQAFSFNPTSCLFGKFPNVQMEMTNVTEDEIDHVCN
jgi:hypothetical protein